MEVASPHFIKPELPGLYPDHQDNNFRHHLGNPGSSQSNPSLAT